MNTDLDIVRKQLHTIADEVDGLVINRWEAIEVVNLALLARYHVFLLGPPGCGKTYFIDLMLDHIGDVKRSDCLFGKLTPLEKVIGHLDLPALAENPSRYNYSLRGGLCDAHVAKLTEFWKGSVALANELLEILNERKFKNDGQTITIPLCTAIADSNEMPQDTGEGLAAAYDRFFFRMVIEPLTDPGDIKRMLLTRLARGRSAKVTPLITWAEMELAQAAVDAMPVADETVDAHTEIIQQLADKGIFPSNRRQNECLSIIQAKAWYDGADEAQPHHLEPLAHGLWDEPSQRQAVERIVYSVCSPLRRRAVELQDEIGELADQFKEAMKKEPRDASRLDAVHEINGKLGEAEATARTLIADSAGGALRIAEDTLRQIEALGDQVLTQGLNFDSTRARRLRQRP